MDSIIKLKQVHFTTSLGIQGSSWVGRNHGIFCQFRSKLAITHNIAIKWKERYDAVVVDCHHCGDRENEPPKKKKKKKKTRFRPSRPLAYSLAYVKIYERTANSVKPDQSSLSGAT